jgi:hypothetical protein
MTNGMSAVPAGAWGERCLVRSVLPERRSGRECVALEIHIITSREFFRVGTHGELDWPRSLVVLSQMARAFVERGVTLALLDVRDARTYLSDAQIQSLVRTLRGSGVRENFRVAVLRSRRPGSRASILVRAARDLGFNFAEFESYERAADWLSSTGEPDPDFDRDVYMGPCGDSGASGARPDPEERREERA